MTRQVLNDGHNAGINQALTRRGRQRGHDLWVFRQGAIANNIVGSGHGDIQTGRAINIDAQISQFYANRLHVDAQSLRRPFRVVSV
jgi:hypothetical protein